MNKKFEPVQLNRRDEPNKAIEIVIAKKQVAEWCLLLSLLLHGLIDAIHIKQSNSFQIEIVKASNATNSSKRSRNRPKRSRAEWKQERVIITLPLYNLESWLYFSLVQYRSLTQHRDVISMVDHFDDELICDTAQEIETLDLTFRVEACYD